MRVRNSLAIISTSPDGKRRWKLEDWWCGSVVEYLPSISLGFNASMSPLQPKQQKPYRRRVLKD
jgi:hypothetical protein